MENKFLTRINESLSKPAPTEATLDLTLKKILPAVGPWSEDLREDKFYLNKPWLEFRDDDNFHAVILHFFNEDNEYLRSVDGDVSSGTWRYLEKSNKLLLSGRNKAEAELFDLAFLDNDFFILAKHGDQQRHQSPDYFVMIHEPLGKKLVWSEAMEVLASKADNSVTFYVMVTIIILLLIAIIWVLM